MKQNYVLPFVLCLLIFLLGDLRAQTRRALQYREHPTGYKFNQRYYSVGGYIGAMNYLGDLAPSNKMGSTSIPLTGPGLGITGMYRLKRYLAVRGSFTWGRLRGDDATSNMYDSDDKFRYARNLHFRNDIKELSLDLVLELSGHHRSFATRRQLAPYIFGGIAVFHHNPKARVPEVDALHYALFNAQPIREKDPRYAGVSPGDWVALKPLGTEGQHVPGSGVEPYSNWQLAIPVGIGLRFRINRHYDLSFEVGYRFTFTDYLDDVSGTYIDPEAFGNGPEANLTRLMAVRAKEPVYARSGMPRDLEHVLENVHRSVPYGQMPAEFGAEPYEMIYSYGYAGRDFIRGKESNDAYIVTKLTLTYIIGAGFGYNKTIGSL